MRPLQFGARQTGQAKREAGLSAKGSAWWGYYLFLYLCETPTLSVLAAPPTKGENIEDIADDFQNLIMPGVMHWQHPSFFAYFPAAGTLESIIGDLYATTVMNPGFNVCVPLTSVVYEADASEMQWMCSPACTELENITMDWMAKLYGLSPDFLNSTDVGGGVIQVSQITRPFHVPED